MDIMLLVGFFGGSYSMGTPYEISSRYIHVKTATGLLGHSAEGAPAELLLYLGWVSSMNDEELTGSC